MHRLLRRQLRKHLGVENEIPEPLKAFIAAVGDAYEDFDSERALLERSTELSSKELSEATDKARRAAEELRESQALFKTVLDNMPAVMFLRDLDGRYQLINRIYEDVYGVSRDTVQGQTLKDVFPKAEADEYGAHDQEAIDKGEPIVKEIRIERDGEERIYSSIKFPIFDASGAPAAVGGIETDVTEEKRAQQELHENESRLRAIFEAAPVAVTIVRQDGTFQFANTRMAEMVGVPRDQLIGQSAREFYVDPKEREVIRKRLGEEGSLYDLEVQMKRADGSAFWGLLSLVRTEEEGEPSYYGWMYDITKRKKAEEAARKRESQLRTVLDNIPAGIYLANRELELEVFNDQFSQLYGFPEGLVQEGTALPDLIRWLAGQGNYGDVDVDALVEERSQSLKSGEVATREQCPPSGLVVQLTYGPAQGEGVCGVLTDITERKEAEEELRQAKDSAENALDDLKAAQVQLVQSEKMASLGQLTAGIAHEIKNPLNFVNNFAETSVELLEDLKDVVGPALKNLDDDDRDEAEDLLETLVKDLGTIGHHGRRADSIVKNMLLHSRGQGSERLPTDLNALVEEGMNLAYHGERARDRGFQVELEPDFDASVGKMTVVPQDIMRVLVNLVGNAFYATKKRREQSGNGYKPVVRISTQAVADGVELRVRDNGTGMPEEVRKKLFTPFFTTKPTGEGTGLGLSISYDIVVQNHGGSMDVDSREGEFTEFVIRLPREGATERGGKA